MIKFFRRIRQKLLTENKFSKYLLYAIGEIVLVVIGILIALSINNWNERRKTKLVEIEIYKEIKVDLTAVLADWEAGIIKHSTDLDNTILLRDHIIQRKPLNDAIAGYLNDADTDDQFFPRSIGMAALKSAGLETLTNDTLRRRIISIYEGGFKRIELLGYHNAPRRNFDFLRPHIDRHLILSEGDIESYPVSRNDSIQFHKRKIVDYEGFLNDQQLLTKLDDAIELRAWKLRMYNIWFHQVEDLSTLIDAELDRLQD